MKTENARATFSLQALLIAMTSIAVFMGLYVAIGPAVFAIVVLGLSLYTGIVAHKAKAGNSYWKCVASIGILLFCVTPRLGRGAEAIEIIAIAILLGIGAYLAYSSVRYGHWATRLLGIVVLLSYISLFSIVLRESTMNWTNIVNFWFPEI